MTLPSAATPLEDAASDSFMYVCCADTVYIYLMLILLPTAHPRRLLDLGPSPPCSSPLFLFSTLLVAHHNWYPTFKLKSPIAGIREYLRGTQYTVQGEE